MILILILAAQVNAPAEIEFRATVRASSLTIEKQGTANLQVTADGQNVVSIEAPKAEGKKRINNPVINVKIEARIADPRSTPQPETPTTNQPQR